MTDKEKAANLGLHVRDLCIEKGVTRDNAKTASLLVQQTALQMAQWKENDILNNICNWLMNNAHKYINSYGSAAYESYKLVEDLRIAIKEKENKL